MTDNPHQISTKTAARILGITRRRLQSRAEKLRARGVKIGVQVPALPKPAWYYTIDEVDMMRETRPQGKPRKYAEGDPMRPQNVMIRLPAAHMKLAKEVARRNGISFNRLVKQALALMIDAIIREYEQTGKGLINPAPAGKAEDAPVRRNPTPFK